MIKTFHNYFKFLDWSLDEQNYVLSLNYEIESIGKVTEVLKFPPFNIANEVKESVARTCDLIHYMCGVSYYKSGLAKEVIFTKNQPSKNMAQFIQKTWKNGLAEMVYENDLSLDFELKRSKVKGVSTHLETKRVLTPFTLIAIGGGKDSLVTIEELKQQGKDISLFMVGNSKLIKEVAAATHLPLIQIERKIDQKLIEYNKSGAFNGHVPITSINSVIGILTALLFGFSEVVFSNERSADSANTINAKGDLVNHQYSKSHEFEKDLSEILRNEVSGNIRYSSYLRAYSELAIIQKFCHYPQYFKVFSSCNRNFHIDGSKNKQSKWCGNCPKCQFVFLGLAAFLDKEILIDIFNANLLDDENQKQGYAELLGLKGIKPFECVGEIAESQLAFNLIKDKSDWSRDVLIKHFKGQFPESTDFQYKQIMQAKTP